MVSYCSSLGWDVKVICSERDVGIFGKEAFEDDCLRMRKKLCFVNGYNEMVHEVFRYIAALTRFKHWVSLKKTDGGYYLYDPASSEFQGGIFGPRKFTDLLTQKIDRQQILLRISYRHLSITVNTHLCTSFSEAHRMHLCLSEIIVAHKTDYTSFMPIYYFCFSRSTKQRCIPKSRIINRVGKVKNKYNYEC